MDELITSVTTSMQNCVGDSRNPFNELSVSTYETVTKIINKHLIQGNTIFGNSKEYTIKNLMDLSVEFHCATGAFTIYVTIKEGILTSRQKFRIQSSKPHITISGNS